MNTTYTSKQLDSYANEMVKQAIADRDKQWIAKIEGNITIPMYTDDCSNIDGDSLCNCTNHGKFKCQLYQWRLIKADLGY